MDQLDVLVFYSPIAETDRILDALFAAGAGRIGDYDECAFVAPGRGQFRPLEGAEPAVGGVGQREYVAENRVELTFPRTIRPEVIAALLAAHPYEEPAFHVLENQVPRSR